MVSFEIDDHLAELFLDLLAQAQMKAPEGQEAAFEKVKDMTAAATIPNIYRLANPTFFGYQLIEGEMETAKERVKQRISKLVEKNKKKKALEELKIATEGLLRQVKVFQDGEEGNEDLFEAMPNSPFYGPPSPTATEGGSKRKRDREEEVEAKFDELAEARKKWKRVAGESNGVERSNGAKRSNGIERIDLEDVYAVQVKVED